MKVKEHNQIDFDLYHSYLESETWDRKRNERLILDDFSCKICKSRHQIQVHHLFYPPHGAYGSESINDLITLCEDCHKMVETAKKSQNTFYLKRSITFDVDVWIKFKTIEEYEEFEPELNNYFIENYNNMDGFKTTIYVQETNSVKHLSKRISLNNTCLLREKLGSGRVKMMFKN